ncbi:MAG TPA: ABC transporter permease [Chitinophagaceae bacterium]|jgi:ABC-2 type transport system permease protein|nr:ABC transporter permease [Chitinophagaceae bacterium]
MPQRYSQSRALWAITRASFKAIFAHPSAIIFSILFPIIFTLIFGAFGSGGAPVYRIAVSENCDTANEFFRGILRSGQVRVIAFKDSAARNKELIKGKLAGVLCVKEIKDSSGAPHYTTDLSTTTASANTTPGFMQLLRYVKLEYELRAGGNKQEYVTIIEPTPAEVRRYRSIDFILPGQLGFSILFSTLFGVAFTFFGLREQLVLKRFYASPVSRLNILIGIGVSRLFFQLLSVIVLLLFGHFVMNFTLHHGIITFFEIIAMTLLMLFLLMGVGLIFSSVAKTDSSIPLLINLFGFPQMMLSGTFFPIEVFPAWLQTICRVLPLTQYNESVRKISFEGLGILDCWKEIGILGVWIVIIYIIAARVIKWE